MSGIATAIVGSAVVGGVVASKGQKAASKTADKALEANAWQGEIAREQYDDYKKTYQPLEQAIVRDASNYDSEENREKAAAEAQATVSTQLGLARDRLSRTPGLDPSSAAAQAAQTNLALKGAAVGANAQNTARETVKNTAYARKFDAVGLGKGLVTNASAGMANAASTAQGIASAQAAQAGATAQGVGSMVAGGINALSQVKWGANTGGYDPAANRAAASAAQSLPV